jgi:hypothetical protein
VYTTRPCVCSNKNHCQKYQGTYHVGDGSAHQISSRQSEDREAKHAYTCTGKTELTLWKTKTELILWKKCLYYFLTACMGTILMVNPQRATLVESWLVRVHFLRGSCDARVVVWAWHVRPISVQITKLGRLATTRTYVTGKQLNLGGYIIVSSHLLHVVCLQLFLQLHSNTRLVC